MTSLQQLFKECKTDGAKLYLPKVALERNFFLEAKKRITLAGGVWQGGKEQCFRFDFPADNILKSLANGEYLNFKKDNQFFETPDDVIDLMVMLADIQKKDSILEPSAGRFAIGKWLWDYCITYDREPIDCYELNEYNQQYLRNYSHANLIGSNFLDEQPTKLYDVILANPPFTRFADIAHVMHMKKFLKPNGRIVSVMSAGWQTQNHVRQPVLFKEFLKTVHHEIYDLEKGSFEGSGTKVNAIVMAIDGSAWV